VHVQPKSSENRASEKAARAGPGAILSQFVAYLAPDLDEVDREIREALASQVDLTAEVGEYLRESSGKRLRPILTLLAARLGGRRPEGAVQAAAMVELLHVASLLHDDVIDRASLRRGRPTVNARWGNDVAILMADYLLSRAFGLALKSLRPPLVGILCTTAAAMSEGEMFQIEKRHQLLSEDDYLFVIRCKTAELFSACARLGASLAGLDEEALEALGRYGLEFGCAFQITDDVLDLTADPKRLGKEIGTDIACGKQTLPFIRALQKANPTDREFLLAALNDGRPPAEVVRCVNKYGGIEYALEKARGFAQSARARLERLPENSTTQLLADLTRLVMERTY